MNIKLTQLEAEQLDKLLGTALRALPAMIKAQPSLETRKEMREHRDALLLIQLKLNGKSES